jgi:hypothetical protein
MSDARRVSAGQRRRVSRREAAQLPLLTPTASPSWSCPAVADIALTFLVVPPAPAITAGRAAVTSMHSTLSQPGGSAV